MTRIGILLGLLCTNIALADTAPAIVYYQRHSEGWFWYHDPVPEQKKKTPKAAPPAAVDPVAVLEAFQKQLDTAKARAVLKPTDENIRAYLQLNQLALNRAGDFATAWQRVVWTTPALDTSIAHPVNDQAVQLYNDEKLRKVDDFLSETAKTYGLFFFFKGSCPYCHRFAPVLKAFAARYGFTVIPITLDDGALPDFPTPRRNGEGALKLKVDTVPAVFLVDPRERNIRPVAYGYVSDSELRERIYTLLNDTEPQTLQAAQLPGGTLDADQ